jgi:hypothetical protein
VLNWQRPTTPVFIAQPQTQTNYVGDSVTFTAQAVGNPAASYQWQFSGTNISGATNASYTKTGLSIHLHRHRRQQLAAAILPSDLQTMNRNPNQERP